MEWGHESEHNGNRLIKNKKISWGWNSECTKSTLKIIMLPKFTYFTSHSFTILGRRSKEKKVQIRNVTISITHWSKCSSCSVSSLERATCAFGLTCISLIYHILSNWSTEPRLVKKNQTQMGGWSALEISLVSMILFALTHLKGTGPYSAWQTWSG